MTRLAEKPGGDETYGRGPYRWYVLTLLTLVYTFHSMDRGLPNILLEPVRHEFALSDSQLGLYSGLAYALAFSLTILPMGYVSDRVVRRNFLVAILSVWSLCTALGGLARNFTQLLLARVGVGASESGAAPVVLPMIADIFPARWRATAIGIFYTSNAWGGLLAGVVGGHIASEYGWRAALFVAGAPGLLLALLLFTTVREPRRGGYEPSEPKGETPAPAIGDVFVFLVRSPGLICLVVACALLGMVGITVAAWLGSFLVRIHGLSLGQVGLVLGVVGGLSSLASPLLFGWLSDLLRSRSARVPLLIVAAGALVAAASGLLMLLTPSLAVAVVALALFELGNKGYPAPCTAVLITNTPVRLRGSVLSVLHLTTNLVGFGIGPLLVGYISDVLGGEGAIRYAIAIPMLGLFVAVALLLLATRFLHGPLGAASPEGRTDAAA